MSKIHIQSLLPFFISPLISRVNVEHRVRESVRFRIRARVRVCALYKAGQRSLHRVLVRVRG